MAIAFNRVSLPASQSGTANKTYAITSSTGNLLVVAITADAGSVVSGVTDNAAGGSNSYVDCGQHSSDANGVTYIFYAKAAKTGVTSVTVNRSSGTAGMTVAVYDLGSADGTAPLVAANALSNQSGTLSAGPAVNQTFANGAIISVISDAGSASAVNAPWVFHAMDSNALANWAFGSHVLNTGTGSQGPTYTANAGTWGGTTVAFKPSGTVTTVNGTKTADAILRKTITATKTANAILLKRQYGSFTQAAILRKHWVLDGPAFDLGGFTTAFQWQGFTADALLKKNQQASATANAVLKKVGQQGTATANAILKKAGQSGSATANASLKFNFTATKTADAVLKKVGAIGSATADALLKAQRQATKTADAILKKAGTQATKTADAVLKKSQSATVTADAILKKVGTVSTKTADAILKKVGTASSVSVDAILRAKQSASKTADAILKRAGTPASASADAVLKKTGTTATATAAAILKKTGTTGSITADAILLRHQSGSVTADAILKAGQSDDVAADAILKKTGVSTGFCIATAVLKKTGTTKTATADAVLLKSQSSSKTADAALLKQGSGSITGNAVLRKTATPASATADSVLKKTGLSGSAATDAVLLKSAASSATASAVLLHSSEHSAVADAILRERFTDDVTADATLLAHQPSSLVADAVLLRAGTASSLTANVILQLAGIESSASADAMLRAGRSDSASADATLEQIGIAASVSGDAVLLQTDTPGSETVDAVLKTSFADSVDADATLLAEQAGAASADAMLSRVVESSATADAVLQTAIAPTITADAILRGRVESTASADAWAAYRIERSVAANAVLSGSTVDSFSADAILQIGPPPGIPVDAILQIEQSSSATADAILGLVGIEGSTSADAMLLAERAGSLEVSAVILRKIWEAGGPAFQSDAFQNDAFQTGPSLTADAYLRHAAQTETRTASADAVLAIRQSGSGTADAWLAFSTERTITADAILRGRIESSATVDSWLALKRGTIVTADALLKWPDGYRRQQATADAVLQRSRLHQVITGGVLSEEAWTLKLEIWPTSGSAWVDYSAWIWDGGNGGPVASKTHRVNEPQQLKFALTSGVAGLAAPVAGNRVRLTTVAFGPWFTGYLTATPELEVLGADPAGNPVYGYHCVALSEEVRLEWQTSAIFPTLPPFANRYQGEIVSAMITALGGGLTTTHIANGILIPFFRVKPDESFMDAVRRLSDKTNMKFWTKNGDAWYQSYGDAAFGYTPTETEARFSPDLLNVAPVQNPVFNDVIAVGQLEPQAYCKEHFVGDGLSASFPLKLAMFGAVSSKLLEDPFTSATIDTTRWTATDVAAALFMSGGSLRMFKTSSSTVSKLVSTRGVEIAASKELRAGRIRFGGQSNVIVGGVYSADTGLKADCVAGFQCVPQGGTTRISPIANGTALTPFYDVRAAKTYQFTLTIDCSETVRLRRPFFSLNNQYGGETVAADATISYSVLELDDNNPDATAIEVLNATTTISNIAMFLYYALLAGPQNSSDPVDLYLNFCSLRIPIQAQLWSKKQGATDWTRDRLGDSGVDPLARATINATSEGHQLVYIADLQPDIGELSRIEYRSAGVARTRVKKSSSITAEAAKAGDSGERTGSLPSTQPAPRDSAELERAIQAYIDDRTTTLYSGDWTFNSKLYPLTTEPLPGRMITVDASSRYPQFTALVTEVDADLQIQQSDGTEVIQEKALFGPLLRLEEEQLNFAPPDEALQGQLDSLIDTTPVEFASVGTSFAADRPDVRWTSKTETALAIDAGAAPDGAYEVRKTDAGWGTASSMNKALSPDPSTEAFQIVRGGSDVMVFIKNRDGGGLVSRYPTMLRFLWPRVPIPPVAASLEKSDPKRPVINLATPSPDAFADVFQLEVRDSDNATVLLSKQVIDESDLNFTYDNTAHSFTKFNVYAYYVNTLGEYSAESLIEIDLTQSQFVDFIGGSSMLQNPSFESHSAQYPTGTQPGANQYLSDNWVAHGGSTNQFTMAVLGSDIPLTGQYNGLIRLEPGKTIADGAYAFGVLANPGVEIQKSIPVRGGEILYFGGYTRWDKNADLPAGVSGYVAFRLWFFDSGGNAISYMDSSFVATPNGGWAYSDGLATVPNGAALVQFYCLGQVYNGSGSAFSTGASNYLDARFDDVFLEAANRSSHSSYRPLSNPLRAHDAGGNVTLTISGFTMQAGASQAVLAGGSILALSYNTLYYIYYDDPAFTGGSIPFMATTVKEVALQGETRYFVGSIMTPLQNGSDSFGNNDGGSGAQWGLKFGSQARGYASGNGILSNPLFAIDSDPTNFTEIDANGASGQFSYYDFAPFSFDPLMMGAKTIRLKVTSEVVGSPSDARILWNIFNPGSGGSPSGLLFSASGNRSKTTDYAIVPAGTRWWAIDIANGYQGLVITPIVTGASGAIIRIYEISIEMEL